MDADNYETTDNVFRTDSNLGEPNTESLDLEPGVQNTHNMLAEENNDINGITENQVHSPVALNEEHLIGHIATWLNDDNLQDLDGTSQEPDSPRECVSETTSRDQQSSSVDTWLIDTLIMLPGHESEHENSWLNTNVDLNTNEFGSWLDGETHLTEKQIRTDTLEGTSESRHTSSSAVVQQQHLTFACPESLLSRSPSDLSTKSKESRTITVKFLLVDGQVYTKAYQLHTKIQEIKESLASAFNIPIEIILLTINGSLLLDNLTLAQLEIKPFGIVEIKCVSTDPNNHPILPSNVYDDIQVPDVINVTVHISEEIIKEVVVEIDNQCIKKPWIGGFCDRQTGDEFHHAFSQTHPRNVCMKAEGKANRDTQTTKWCTKDQNTVSDKSTQMGQRNNHIPCIHDKVISPKPYVTYDEIKMKQNILNKVLTIQRYIRGWFARKMIKHVQREYKEETVPKRRVENLREISAKNNPRTRADFDLLYNMVERWRQAQVTALRGEAPKRAQMCHILEKEIVILSSIEKHRIRVREEKLAQKEIDFLEKSSQPIKWTGHNGQTISMDTISTQRAREFKQMFNSLCNHDMDAEERVNLLISLKHALKAYNNCDKVTEIIDLMDRECECLIRGLKHSQLDILRMRLRNMFLSFVKDPIWNTDHSNHTAVSSTESSTMCCEKCRKIMPLSKFKLNSCSKIMKNCISCCWIENIARPRTDLWPYGYMLSVVRKEEQKRCCYSSVAFVMQEEDFYHLVVHIWHSQSSISKSTDLNELCLSRWDLAKDWAPWNCILLNNKEARVHNQSKKSLEKTYEAEFIESVSLKHLEARVHFQQLASIDTQFRESGRWTNHSNPRQYSDF